MNEQLAFRVIQEAILQGTMEFCVCPGNRNSPLYTMLMQTPSLKKYFWPEERSAAFFALGRSRATSRPVAVVTTSGTAAGEILPAAMEAYYTGVPLLLITADRPRRFRGTGAPQTAEQKGLFGIYATTALDIEGEEKWDLNSWTRRGPIHLNVCFEEPFPQNKSQAQKLTPQLIAVSELSKSKIVPKAQIEACAATLDRFLKKTKFPFVVVSAIPEESQQAVAQFLLNLKAPVLLEGVSGLRQDPRLEHLQVMRTDNIWSHAEKAGYAIDGVLRIGGIPTFRMWRDLEEKQGQVDVCSFSEHPFSGLSWGSVECISLAQFFQQYHFDKQFSFSSADQWLSNEKVFHTKLLQLFKDEPQAEPSLLHDLSCQIPNRANVYLGNSLPIREWDLASTRQPKQFRVTASRGLNGIDGQLSTFFGFCQRNQDNWAIVGDLTTLYDLVGPWILPQIEPIRAQVVVINNGGGKIFTRFLNEKEFLNAHQLNFEPLARLWSLKYACYDSIPVDLARSENQLIELVPNETATERFHRKLGIL